MSGTNVLSRSIKLDSGQKRILTKKIKKRFNGADPDGINQTSKKCFCGFPVICVLFYNGTIDVSGSFIHFCLNPRCIYVERHDSRFLREGEEAKCLLCAQKEE